MICSEAKLKLEPCVSGTLSPDERVALEEHLAICEGCRLELELTRAVMGVTAPEAPDEPPVLPVEAPLVESEPELMHPEPPPPSTVFDEISFADVGSELSTSSPPGAATPTPPGPGESAAGPSGPDPLANLAPKPEPAKLSSEKWDFEPAEVPRDSGPPEASLSIAHEALKRKREVDEKRKAAFVRLALWGGGIGCGLVLLGVSVWMALAFRQDKPPDSLPNGGAPSVVPAPADTTPAPPEPSAAPVSPDIGATPSPVPPSSTTTDAAMPTPTPDSRTAPPPAPTLLEATPGVAPSPGPPPPATKGKPKPGAKAAAKPASGATARKGGGEDDNELFPWKPVDDPPIRRRAPVRQSAALPAPNPSAQKAAPPEPSPPQPAPVNPEAGRPETGTTPSEAAPAPETTAPPAHGEAEPAPQTTKAPPSTKPIDRAHLATEKAAKDGDLDALRKLKSAWKSLIGSTAGPDRARAKREYADCLWSIAEITGRNSDRREALAAYRDYVLYAPAGGTDPRTVGRMRQLEDILSDK